MNQFGLVQTVDCLGQCVVVTVATATNRGLDARFGQSLAIANANVLRASVGVTYQRSIEVDPVGRTDLQLGLMCC
jgi:hypothetical protein